MNINSTILGQTIAFILFILFCMKYVWPAIIDIIEKRQKEIANGLIYTEKAKQTLNLARSEADQYIGKAKIEAQSIIEQANKYKNYILDKAKSDAEIERKRIMQKMSIEIDVERKRVSDELHKQISMLIIAGIEKVTEQSIHEDLHSKIIDKIVNNL